VKAFVVLARSRARRRAGRGDQGVRPRALRLATRFDRVVDALPKTLTGKIAASSARARAQPHAVAALAATGSLSAGSRHRYGASMTSADRLLEGASRLNRAPPASAGGPSGGGSSANQEDKVWSYSSADLLRGTGDRVLAGRILGGFGLERYSGPCPRPHGSTTRSGRLSVPTRGATLAICATDHVADRSSRMDRNAVGPMTGRILRVVNRGCTMNRQLTCCCRAVVSGASWRLRR